MLNQNIPFIGWMAALSNGETVREQPPIPGEKSSWQKLLDRLTEENIKMVGLCIRYLNTTVNALPPKACQGYYQARDQAITFYHGTESGSIRQGIGSVVDDKVFITWLDANGNTWQDVRLLSSEKIHSTMRDIVLPDVIIK